MIIVIRTVPIGEIARYQKTDQPLHDTVVTRDSEGMDVKTEN